MRSVVPCSTVPVSTAARPLPLPALAALPATAALVCGMGRLDSAGRIVDGVIVDPLHWRAGTRVHISTVAGVVLIRRDPDGLQAVTAKPGVTIPVAIRRGCGLLAGDRVLLAAIDSHDLLIAYPPRVVTTMVASWHAALDHGG